MTVFPTLLAQAAQNVYPKSDYWPILVQWLLPLIPVMAFYVLVFVCLWKAAKYFNSAVREQKLLRMEMGKLAEEVHLLRQEIKGKKTNNSLA